MTEDLLPIEEHQAIMQNIMGIVRSCFENQGSFVPMVHLIHPDSTMSLICIADNVNSETGGGRTKDAIEEMLIKVCEENQFFDVGKGVTGICIASEAWTLHHEDLAGILENGRLKYPIAEHPNRVEIISIQYTTPKWNLMATAEILRKEVDPWGINFSLSDDDDNEEKPELAAWEIMPPIPVVEDGKLTSDGRFTNFWRKANQKKKVKAAPFN